MNQLVAITDHIHALVAAAGKRASYRFLEFFTAQIRNPNTRRAYARAAMEFFAWLAARGVTRLTGMVRDLKGTMDREKALLGLFLTLNKPTREMEREAASAGIYETGGMKVPRLQILTAAQILDNRRPQVPFGFTEGFRNGGQEKEDKQAKLL